MKILHIESGRHLYGGALQVVMLIEGLTRRGVECHLACPVGSAIAEAARPHAAAVHETVMRGDVDVATLFRLRQLIRKVRPDVVHLHSRFGTDIWGALAARLEGVAVVHSRRVDNSEPRLWVNIKYRLYDKVVAISNGIREVLLSEGLPPTQVICVHSSVDTQTYRAGRGDMAWFRDEFELQDGDVTVAMVAQFIVRKGHRTLLDALPAVLAAHPRTRVIFFGQGPQEAAMRQLVQERQLGAQVQFAGFRNDMARVLPCLDVVAHPAMTEGLGVALLQAAACGVPIVASRTGGIPEIVQPGETGELVEPGHVGQLSAALVRVLDDSSLRSRYGSSARAHIEAGFSVDSMVEGNLAVYREVLDSRRLR
ncbi:glycosyltransferase family 4 protein [soil metagenome]